MAKIYNEIVIDMNPQSPSFEETLYEDSFEYSGDMMLMQDLILAEDTGEAIPNDGQFTYYNGQYYMLQTTDSGETSYRPLSNKDVVDLQASGEIGALPEEYQEIMEEVEEHGLPEGYESPLEAGASTEWGAPEITKDMFINPDGTPKTIREIYAELDPILTGITGADLHKKIEELLPKFQGVPDEERAFKAEEYGGVLPEGVTSDLDVDGDGTISFSESLTGQGAGITYDAAGVAYDAAGRVYETAGLTKELAEETYELGISGAEREKGTMLSGLQDAAYGVTSADARGKIRGSKKIKEGFETGMGAFKDAMTGLEGDWGRAQDVYDIAGRAYTSAGETYGLAGEAYDLAETGAGQDYKTSIYDLEKTAAGVYETDVIEDIGTWDAFGDPDKEALVDPYYFTSSPTVTPISYRKGGRVPSKETFSHFLTQLPDAGGV